MIPLTPSEEMLVKLELPDENWINLMRSVSQDNQDLSDIKFHGLTLEKFERAPLDVESQYGIETQFGNVISVHTALDNYKLKRGKRLNSSFVRPWYVGFRTGKDYNVWRNWFNTEEDCLDWLAARDYPFVIQDSFWN